VEHVTRTNTILYCNRWSETVAFYASVLGLPITFENDWFVEFRIGDNAFVSVADGSRSSVRPGDGAGLTLSWEVSDLEAAHASLAASGATPQPIAKRFGANVFDVFDPTGNRIEFWSSARPSTVE